MTELARAVAVEKRYGELVAVKAATCSFRASEIHAVCGENGAGKSTLLKIVAGMVLPNEGHVEAFGSRLTPHTPREAIQRGIGMVLQHFALVPVFTALENIVLGAEPTTTGGILDLDAAKKRALAIAKDLGVDLPLDKRVEELGIGDRQRLEIARALFRDAKLLILDEPTAVLTKGEAKQLYATLRRLAEDGKGIVVVTHKMDEVRAHADIVTVMRRGELVFTRAIDRAGDVAAQVDEVTAAIMGGAARGTVEGADVAENAASYRDSAKTEKATVLALHDVRLGRALGGITFDVRAGEIIGIAGIEGNGQRELVEVLAGDKSPDAGKVEGGPFAIVRDDRQHEGLVLDATLRDNILLGELDRFANTAGVLDLGALEHEAKSRLDRSGAPKDLDRPARTLSGGNQQKIVVERALARIGTKGTGAKVLVAAQPTRGVDLAASIDIHERLRGAANSGVGVVVLSADLDELRKLSSRILVIARGRIVADLPPTATDEELGRKMLGMAPEKDAEAHA